MAGFNEFEWVGVVLLLASLCALVSALNTAIYERGLRAILLHILNSTIMGGIAFTTLFAVEIHILASVGISLAVAYIGIDGVIEKAEKVINLIKGKRNEFGGKY